MDKTFLCEEEKLDVLYFINNGSPKAISFIRGFTEAVSTTRIKDIVISVETRPKKDPQLYICPKGEKKPIKIPFTSEMFAKETFNSLSEYLDPIFIETFRETFFTQTLKIHQKNIYSLQVSKHINTLNSFILDPRNKGYTVRKDGHEYVFDNGLDTIEMGIYKDGNIKYVNYVDKDGNVHREDGPAHISYYENGQVNEESYFRRDKRVKMLKYKENGELESVRTML